MTSGMDDNVVREVVQAVLEETKTDIVGFWVVLWEMDQMSPKMNDEERRRAALEVVARVLATGRVVAGTMVPESRSSDRFVRWDVSSGEVLERIRDVWAALGRDPMPGEVAWFVDPNLLPLWSLRELGKSGGGGDGVS